MIDTALMQMMQRITALERESERNRGELGGLWVAFTPVFYQGGAVTATVNYGRYAKIGKTAIVHVMMTATGAGTVSNLILIQGLPAAIAPLQYGAFRIVGSGFYYDSSLVNPYFGATVEMNSSGSLALWGYATNHYFGFNPTITVASGDVIAAAVTYEIA